MIQNLGVKEPTAARTKPKIAYIMSRFPKLTETFILYEVLAVEQEDVTVELYPLMREKTTVMHPEAVELVERAHFQPIISLPILRSQLHFLMRKPGAYLKALGITLRTNWGSLRYLAGILSFFPKAAHFAYLMERDGVQHVHAHFVSHPTAVAFIIHRLTGIPFSFTAHGSDLHRDQHMLREKVDEAAFGITVSNYNKEVIVKVCGDAARAQVMILHCGVDTEFFHPRELRTTDFSSTNPFSILCIGTLHEVKGQTYLIEAAGILHQRGLSVVCNFIGDGPDEPALKEQVERAGLQSIVKFCGRKTHAEVADALNNADVVVAPSVVSRDGRREGIPVVLMEAMGSGVPVIASDLSGIPELVNNDKSGVLVPPGDAQAIADALERLYHDPVLRQRLGDGGCAKVLEDFNLQKNAAQLVALFTGATQGVRP